VASDEYDEYDATVRVPKGEKLARSRDTPGAHRGFSHSGDRKMEHAEIFLKGEDEQELIQNPPPVIIINEPAPALSTGEQNEFDELLQALVLLGLIRAAEIVSPYIKRWLKRQALPFLKARWEGLRERRRKVVPDESSAVIGARPVEGSEEVVTALAEFEASMTSEQARRHFVEALVARRFADEKMRLLANARIEDSAVPPELASAVQALTPKQVEESLNSMLATNPYLVDDLGKLLKAGRDKGPLQLGSGKIKEALRLTEDER
jgi:hypothetical protein